jgi:hypothetical protein
MAMHLQYVGFQLKTNGREYLYRVILPKAESREFTMTITNRAFAERHVRYQDGAIIGYQKLQRALEQENPEEPLPRRSTLSDQELDDYLAAHRPARKRTW